MKISFKKVNQASASPVRELALILFLCLVGLAMHVGVQSQDDKTVTATVTAQQVALSVSDGSVSYGTLSVGTTMPTFALDPVDTQTATNDGNVNIDIGIQGQNSDPNNWALSDTAIGDNQYMHLFSTAPEVGWTAMTNDSYTTMVTEISSSGTQNFDLNIHMPQQTTHTAEQSVDVSVQATASVGE